MKVPPYPEYPKIASEAILLRKIRPEEISEISSISFYDEKQAATIKEATEMLQRMTEALRLVIGFGFGKMG